MLAAVNGPAVGIGCSLALACDLIVARESAYFLLAFVNIGLVPDGGSSLFVPARIGSAARGRSPCSASGSRPRRRSVGPRQPRGGRRGLRGGGRRPGRAARRGPDPLLRRRQAPAQRHEPRPDGRAARARGRDPAGDGGVGRLRRGRAAFLSKRAARFAALRRLARGRQYTAHSVDRPRPPDPRCRRALAPARSRSPVRSPRRRARACPARSPAAAPNAEDIAHALRSSSRWHRRLPRGRGVLFSASSSTGPRRAAWPRRSTAIRSSRSAGRSAPRSSSSSSPR